MIGIFLNPVMWLAFTLESTGRERPLTARTLTLIAIVPAIALLLVQGGKTISMVTHDRDLAGNIPRVEEVRNGQLVSPEEIDRRLVAG